MILVTGATGFLGHSLIPRLAASGHNLRVLVRPTSYTTWMQPYNIELYHGDITEPDSVLRAAEGVSAIIHAAALFRFWGDPAQFHRINVTGTANILAAAIQHRITRLVHISTVVVVGKPTSTDPITEDTPCHPLDGYQHSKLHAESLVKTAVANHGLPAIILRPAAFYGPGGRYAWNRLFFEDPLMRGLRVQIFRGQRLTFPVYVADVAQAAELALTRGQPGHVYNIADDPITHRHANTVISRAAGVSEFRLNVPASGMLLLARLLTALGRLTGHEPFYPDTLAHYVFPDWNVSSARARAELGFTPTPFKTGVRATLDWYAQTGLLKRPRTAS